MQVLGFGMLLIPVLAAAGLISYWKLCDWAYRQSCRARREKIREKLSSWIRVLAAARIWRMRHERCGMQVIYPPFYGAVAGPHISLPVVIVKKSKDEKGERRRRLGC